MIKGKYIFEPETGGGYAFNWDNDLVMNKPLVLKNLQWFTRNKWEFIVIIMKWLIFNEVIFF